MNRLINEFHQAAVFSLLCERTNVRCHMVWGSCIKESRLMHCWMRLQGGNIWNMFNVISTVWRKLLTLFWWCVLLFVEQRKVKATEMRLISWRTKLFLSVSMEWWLNVTLVHEMLPWIVFHSHIVCHVVHQRELIANSNCRRNRDSDSQEHEEQDHH